MKKLSFIFAMVFAASMAMAQTANVNQTSVVSVPQSVQTATVDQTGLSTVNITQNADKVNTPLPGTAKAFNHEATATQTGDNNVINITQIAEGNVDGIVAEKNVAKATQVSKWNTMNQTQISGDWTSGGMVFTAYQEGTGNVGTQYGKKTSSNFNLYQYGESNTSNQSTTGEKTGVLVGDVKQIGTRHIATQLFHGEDVRDAGAFINQNGSYNTATQEFSMVNPTMWGSTPSSHADIIQTNIGNTAYQSQVGQGSYQKTEQYGTYNNSTLRSTGDFNNAYSYQAGDNGIIVVDQKKSNNGVGTENLGNLTKIYQNGNHSEAYIMQDGSNNKVVGLSDGDYAINNNDSYLNVSQTGVGNTVRSSQVVSTASETVVQVGNANTAIVNQH